MSDRIQKLLAEMTLPEKLAQLTQLLGEYYVSEDYGKLMGLSYGFHVPHELAWNVGSILGMAGARKLRMVQERYMEQSRLKIPLMFMADVIHGYRTIFPSPLGLACSWNPELARETAAVAARESAAAGLHVTFSPMADLARDARWGRMVETTGEDPLLGSQYARAFVQGYQGENPRNKGNIAACVKHFAGYGAAEGGRDYNTTEISPYFLDEYYLPAYKAAVEAGCRLVMTAFNALNGIPCTGDRGLMEDLLRGQWGFDGVVISDCTAVCELVAHGYCEDAAGAARAALHAGVDIEMVSVYYWENVGRLLEERGLDMAVIDRSVERVLRLKEELGLFENPYKDADENDEEALMLCPAHRALSRDAAIQSFVLLKNDGALPLPEFEKKKIALIGPHADETLYLDIWKCEGREEDCVPLADALRQAGCTVRVEKGCGFSDASGEEMERAVALAVKSDVVVLALGEHPDYSAEAGSRAYLGLPGRQVELARRVAEAGKPVIALVFGGRSLELAPLKDVADAVMMVWFPGTEGGPAIADVLLGRAEPGGRLVTSFPHTVGQMPLYYNALPTGRPKGWEDNPERFVSRYVDAPNGALYPFGYGLGYTRFEYGELELNRDEMDMRGEITASVTVRNAGERAGNEVVQLYLRDMGGSRSRPVKELKDYRRISLQPGEEHTVRFKITPDMLSYHTAEGLRAEPGAFTVWAAPHSGVDAGAGKRFTLRV